MRIFKITPEIEVVCKSEKTKYGFRHLATLLKQGIELNTSKACYHNRTWERFEFQSVLLSVINKSNLSDEEKTICKKFAEEDKTDWSQFQMVKTVANLGEIFCENKKDKNNWKVRMIKAGLPQIDIPEGWNELSEEEKERRLNLVIGELSKHG